MQPRQLRMLSLATIAMSLACATDDREHAFDSSAVSAGPGPGNASSDGTEATTTAWTTTSASGTTSASSGADGVDTSGTSGPKYDVDDWTTAGPTTGASGDACSGVGHGEGGMGTPEDCIDKAQPDSFEPAIQWTWDAPDGRESAVSPLVGNFTDDNGDGKIEPCGDIPDLVVVSSNSFEGRGHVYVLDGATGAPHFKIPDNVDLTVTPAIGDIDGDGLLEIVAAVNPGLTSDNLAAFEHDGTAKWVSTDSWDFGEATYSAIALADLDNDGDIEIMAGTHVHDHTGTRLWTAASGYVSGYGTATAAADLDGDGDLEVVLGHAAYHHDGSQYYLAAGVEPGYPHIADLDGDPEPEVLITSIGGLSMVEHTGQVKYQGVRPTGDAPTSSAWIRPAAVHDFDGNGVSEFATSSANNYTVYNGDATIVWSAPISDLSGSAAGTAFDFLGDAMAEAMYADETNFFIFNEVGIPYFSVPRSSGTIIEYPVVADLDNDGSAEIAVVSMLGPRSLQTAATVQVIRDKEDRWIQARRIWNQHTYHVTNVNENGTIPQFEAPSWKALNTFRTQAQIDDGGICKPPPPAE